VDAVGNVYVARANDRGPRRPAAGRALARWRALRGRSRTHRCHPPPFLIFCAQADTNNSRIRLLTADGNVVTLTGQGSRTPGSGGTTTGGGGTATTGGDGGGGVNAGGVNAGALALTNPAGLSIDLYLQNFEADMRWRRRRRRRRSSSRRLLAG
jgi:hypothetical protein